MGRYGLRMITRSAAPVVTAAALTGCVLALDPDSHTASWFNDSQMSFAGTNQVIPRDSLAEVKLVPLICSYLSKDGEKKALTPTASDCPLKDEAPGNLAQAFYQFSAAYSANSGGGGTLSAASKASLQSMAKAAVAASQSSVEATKDGTDTVKSLVDALADSSKEPAATKAVATIAAAKVQTQTTAASQAAAAAFAAAADADKAVALADTLCGAVESGDGTYDDATVAAVQDAVAMMASSATLAAAAADSVTALNTALAADNTETVDQKKLLAGAMKIASAARAAAAGASKRARYIGLAMGGQTIGQRFRNEIQETIVAAADRRCQVYKTVLTRAKTESGFWVSALTSVTGATGSLVSDTVSRYLAGSAGGVSAIGSAFDNSVFQGQAIDLIIHGIDTAQSDWRNNVFSTQRQLSLSQYTLQQAIEHAMEYNSQCSMPAALHYVAAKLAQPVDVNAIVANQALGTYRQSCANKAITTDGGPSAQTVVLASCQTAVSAYAKLVGVTPPAAPTAPSQ